jgi:hypothetical protein
MVLNKHTSITERSVSYRKDEISFNVQPQAQDIKMILQITTKAKHLTLP